MKGILKKMLINISLLVVVISVFLGAVSYYVSSGALISETEASLLSKANDNAKLLEERMAGKSKELETLAAQNDITGMNWQQQKPLLEKEAKRLDYLGIAIVDLQGQARYTDESTLDLSDRDYVQKSLKGQKAISDIIISRKTNQPVLMLSVPIQRDQQIVGVLIARIDGFYLSQIVADIKWGKTGFTYIMNKKGTILGHPDHDLVVKETNYIEQAKKDAAFTPLSEATQQILRSQEGVHLFPMQTGNQLMGYAPIHGTDWFIVTGALEQEVKSGLGELQLLLLLFSGAALVFGVANAFLLSRHITKPIISVQNAGQLLAQGDFSQPINQQLTVRKDEIGSLARSFETMRVSLREMISRINTTAEQVASSSEELFASSEQVSQATSQIATTMETVANRTTASATASSETKRAMEETNIGLHRIAESSTLVLDAALESNQAAKQGNATILRAISQMNQINTSVSQSSSFVSKLIAQTKAVEDFVAVIGQISTQTNLLALNASIEAARAGEHGLGFAVVAENVRKLAEESQAAAKEVVGIVQKINEETAMVLQAMDQGKSEVEAGVEIIHNAEAAFLQIMASMEKVTEQISEVSSASEQLSASSDEVTVSMEEMTKLSLLTAKASEEVSTATEEQMASMLEVTSSSKSLSDLAAELQEMVSRFKR